MALSAYVGSFTQPAATGARSVTGVGFTPKVVLFWSNGATADGVAADSQFMFGVGISSSDRRVSHGINKDQSSASATLSRTNNASNCIRFVAADATPTVLGAADFVSQDSDGFTVTFSTTDGIARVINFLALGGTTLTNVKGGTLDIPAATGNSPVTGVGFTPDSLLLFWQFSANSPPEDAGTAVVQPDLGFAVSTTQRAALGTRFNNFANPSQSGGYQRTTKMLVGTSATGTVNQEADLASMDVDGFTFNVSTAPAVTQHSFFLALKGVSLAVGSLTQPSSTGVVSTSGLGFRPYALALASFNQSAATTAQAPGSLSFGVAAGTAQRFAQWTGVADNSASAFAKRDLDRTKIIKLETVGSTPSVNAAADLSSFTDDAFALSWTTADATPRQVVWWAIGDAPQNLSQASASPIGATAAPVISTGKGAWASIRPAQDVSIGSWTDQDGGVTDLHSPLNEVPASDATYDIASYAVTDVLEERLANFAVPSPANSYTFSYRYAKDFPGGQRVDLQVELRQGDSTQIVVWTHTDISGTLTQADQVLTAPQIALITNPRDVRLRVTQTRV